MMWSLSRAFSGSYGRLLNEAKKYWPIFLIGVFGTIMLSVIDASFAGLITPLINDGFINRNDTFIKMLPIFIILIFLLRGVAGFLSNYFINRVARNVVRDFRRKIFAKFLHIPTQYYDRNNSGHLLSTIVYNVEQVARASSESLLILVRESTYMVGLIVVMFLASWKLSGLILVISPLVAWVLKWSSSRMRRLSSNVQEAVGEVTHVADEGIQGHKVIRLYGGEDYEYQKFHEATKRNQQRELKIVVTNSVGTAYIQILIAIPIAITVLLALMPSLGVSAGAFASLVAAMVMFLRPVRRLTMVNGDIQKGIAGADSLFEILDEEVEQDTGTLEVDRVAGNIDIEHVTFAYEADKEPVLHDVNLKVKHGQTVAIVGRSGGGKSTLINLLPRFYEVTDGVIKIDGIDISKYRLRDLRKQFALVSQQTILFNDTIANNIAYGLNDVSPDKILEAARAAHAMEFIENLPDGLETVVGENGVLLSGGQRQRIAIARALLKNSPILILDEATSALDSHAEQHIQQALETLMQQRTTVVIAHRLSTIENADWIFVMENGRIVEQGTHATLLQQGAAYAKLHRAQFKDQTAHAYA